MAETPDLEGTILRLEITCAIKDSQIAQLHQQLANARFEKFVEKLRTHEGADPAALFDIPALAFRAGA